MNQIDTTVSKILEGPYKVITDEVCCFELIVETDCYGCKGEGVVRMCTKSEIDKVKVGTIYQGR